MSFDNDWKPRFQSLALSWSHFVGECSWGYAQDWLWHCLEWHLQEDGGGMKWDLTMLHNLPMRNPGLVLNSINSTNVPCTCLPWWGSETYSREVLCNNWHFPLGYLAGRKMSGSQSKKSEDQGLIRTWHFVDWMLIRISFDIDSTDSHFRLHRCAWQTPRCSQQGSLGKLMFQAAFHRSFKVKNLGEERFR